MQTPEISALSHFLKLVETAILSRMRADVFTLLEPQHGQFRLPQRFIHKSAITWNITEAFRNTLEAKIISAVILTISMGFDTVGYQGLSKILLV